MSEITRLPSNLRQTTRDCLYLCSLEWSPAVTWPRMRSHDWIRHSQNLTRCTQTSRYLGTIYTDRSSTYSNREFRSFMLLRSYTWSDDLIIQTWHVFSEDVPADWKRLFYLMILESNRIIYVQAYTPTDIHCVPKSDAKIQIAITMAHLSRINYPLSSFNYRLSGTNLANFNKIRHIVSEQQLIKNGTQKQNFPILKIPIRILTAESVIRMT